MLTIIPTDTCYGLSGEFTEIDYNQIYRLKGRDFSKPLAVLVREFSDMSKYVQITDEQVEFLRQYPHPWSFLGMRRSDFILPEWIDSSLYSYISLRVAENCIDGSIRDTLVYPLWLTSANLSGKLESKTLSRAREFFPGVDGIDGGLCDQLPSDIFGIGIDGQIEYYRKNY